MFQPVAATPMNISRMPILIATMIALTLADSLAPRINSSAHMAIRMTAGRLMTPPSSGEFDSASGIWKPKTSSRNRLR